MKIIIFANTVYTQTLTGGDRIFAEFAKKWISWGHEVTIITNEAGFKFCTYVGVPKENILIWGNSKADSLGVYVSMFAKALICLFAGFFFYKKADVILASSFFVPDIVPAFFLKLKNRKATLTTASYLFSTKKWGADYSGGKLKGFLFYINELISFFITKISKGKILTAAAYDRDRLVEFQKFKEGQVLAIRGGVDNEFFSSVSEQAVKYDGLFIGRFHPQKCIDELIEIWSEVVRRSPRLKLALIGAGEEEENLKALVGQKGLEENIFFLGVKDGIEKTKIIKSSRVFVSASRFDSGNIALDEALSCGIPGIVYNLPRLDYPMGVIKIDVGNHNQFVSQILAVLSNKARYKKLSDRAIAFALKLDWNQKAKEVLDYLS